MTGLPLLVVLAALAVVNPPRLSPALTSFPPLGVDSTSIRRPVAPALVAAGAAAAVVGLAPLVVLAGRILDTLDVSPPTLRIGTGLVLVVAVLRDLVEGRPAAEPALDGWGAALVPVALPFVARPELGLLVMSAATIEGPGVAFGALAAVGVGLVAMAWAGPKLGTAGLRIVAALAWASAVGTVAAGIALAVDGVYGV